MPIQIKIMERMKRIFVIGWKEVICSYWFNLVSGKVVYSVHLDFSREKSKHIRSPPQFCILADNLLFMNVTVVFNSDRELPSLC